MFFYNENVRERILDVLNCPIVDRCVGLPNLLERCTLRELQDIFPTLVHNIFGIGTGCLGWGLRTTTNECAPQAFHSLVTFLSPTGCMLHLCYRLLTEAIKFEFNLELLPHKVMELIQSGQHSNFYADLLNIEPFRRQVTSLSLNAFDYYILHFVIHGTFPLHRMYPAALQVHNERLKTAYFYLTADYLDIFLPANPDSIVYPENICLTVKTPKPKAMPVQPIPPKRSPKYLKIPNINLYADSNNTTVASSNSPVALWGSSELSRIQSWRSESVMYFFNDVWLRFDMDEARELPSIEFIRVVRIFVKQMHSFSNSASRDLTVMSSLRKKAQPMMKSLIYPFFISVISRWPLDDSLMIVLELWLSYIQPWRYTFEMHSISDVHKEIPITSRYDNFINDNLFVYTQIFLQFLSRFDRLDFTSLRNVLMLNRLVRVFSQNLLPKKIYSAEQAFVGNASQNFDTSQSHSPYSSFKYNSHNSSGGSLGWENTIYHEDKYIPMFGPVVQAEVEHFLKSIGIARMCVQQEINLVRNEMLQKQKSLGIFKKFVYFFIFDNSQNERKLQEMCKIPDLLDIASAFFLNLFEVELPHISTERFQKPESSFSQINFSGRNNGELDISKFSPGQMRRNVCNISTGMDPALLPICNYEIKFLVRLLHRVSCHFNEKYGEEIQYMWDRPDILGKIARRVLTPPMTAQWFDKPEGVSELFESELPARLCLRPLASLKVLFLIGLIAIIGRFFCGSYIFGFISSLFLFVLCIIMFSIFS